MGTSTSKTHHVNVKGGKGSAAGDIGGGGTFTSTNMDTGVQEDSMNVRVCNLSELENERAVCVDVGSHGKALLYRQGADVSAVGARCSHYCAPLINGVQSAGHIRCPWHGACFNLVTGDIEEYPGLDGLPKYQVNVQGNGDVHIVTTAEELKAVRRVREAKHKMNDPSKVFVVVGGGPASVSCVESLRRHGFTGRCVMICEEPHLPYDKPKLSKSLGSSADSIRLRDREFYESYEVELRLSTRVTGIDTGSSILHLSDGSKLTYSKLMVAPGGRPRELTGVKGHELDNICYVRTPEGANRIARLATEKRVVVIGTSFIGMEAAAYLCGKASSVTVVGNTSVPFERVLGRDIGAVLMKLCEEKGIKFYNDAKVTEFLGDDDKRLRTVVLGDGTELVADVCVVGAGVVPRTELFTDTGAQMNERKQVVVNKKMQTTIPDIYACGDIVVFPLYLVGDSRVNIQHWQMAHHHGHIAALNMLGQEQDIHSVPYFWTSLFGQSVRYTGYSEGYDDIIIHGSLEDRKFFSLYTRVDEVCAAASLCYDPVVSQVAEMFAQNKRISKQEALDESRGWAKRLDC